MPPDFRRLSVFRAVVNHGGVIAAARVLHKSPSAVTYDLQQLERALGARLFRKAGRRLALTAQGRTLAASIERAYLDLQHAWDGAAGGAETPEPLRIACVSGYGRYRLLPGLLARLPRERPLEVLFRTANEVLALLESGRVGLGVSYRPLVTAGIASAPLAEETLVLVGPKAARRAPAPQEIAALPFVTYEEFDYVFFRWFEAHDLALPQPWRRVDHFDELEEALESVACGRGWSVVPFDAANGRAYRTRVRIHHLQRRVCHNQIHLVGSTQALQGEDAALVRQAASA
ncbi:LysR family transcriptional regulator [Luteimonas aquatica]|uniref:LysR family transcriptional regulator n=1 Tax=Luteimonas aquatica TaxID=450364 RepID=UPI001F5753C9|nr:LysR family transcriptional regulator [Luteimonas aquatica]